MKNKFLQYTTYSTFGAYAEAQNGAELPVLYVEAGSEEVEDTTTVDEAIYTNDMTTQGDLLIEQGELMVLRPMCLIELGNTSEAHEAINSLATACESDIASKPGNHDFLETNVPCYDIAAAYAMLGDSDNALKFLDLHFTHDYLSYNFGRLERDSRFDSLRDLPRFNQLVEKYLKKWKGEQ